MVFVVMGLGAEGQNNRSGRKWPSPKQNTHRHATRSDKSAYKHYDMIGISFNSLNYFGDLAPLAGRASTDLAFTKPGISISYNRKMGPRFSLQTQLLWGVISGSDAESAKGKDGVFRRYRNLSFRNRIKELSVSAVFDLIPYEGFYLNRPPITPYVIVGAGIFHHNPQARVPETDLTGKILPNRGEWVDLQPLGTEGQYSNLENTDVNFGNKPYKRIQPSLFLGLGFRFRLNAVIDFLVESTLHQTYTDYLDDTSKNYVDLGVLNTDLARTMAYRTNELGGISTPYKYSGRDGNEYSVRPGYGSEGIGSMRGNKDDNDYFFVNSIRVNYKIGKSFHKAKFR
jgi:hypothetical protein